MDQRLNVITLGVSDLERSKKFYCDGLGWKPAKSSSGDIVFIDLGGVVLALYPRQLLAEDAKVDSAGSGFGGITLAQNVATKAEVDAALVAAKKAGGKILKEAQEVFWGGYSGYFADPDENPWEIAWNPNWKLVDGKVRME